MNTVSFYVGMQDIVDDYGDLDDSAVDAEGPTALMYRYSRRKSDSKSDENSQNSELNIRIIGSKSRYIFIFIYYILYFVSSREIFLFIIILLFCIARRST